MLVSANLARLWGWLNLLVLPAAITTVMALTSTRARRPDNCLRPHHKTIIAAMAAGWIVTVIGGYALRWRWTGYPGHTLWDWLGMLDYPVFHPIGGMEPAPVRRGLVPNGGRRYPGQGRRVIRSIAQLSKGTRA